MAGPGRKPDEIGAIQIRTPAPGRVQATAKMRDEDGELRGRKATGDTEDEARTGLGKQAEDIRYRTLGPVLGLHAKIAQACEVFAYEEEQSPTVEDTTMESCRSTIRHVVNPAGGSLPLKRGESFGVVDRAAEHLHRQVVDGSTFERLRERCLASGSPAGSETGS